MTSALVVACSGGKDSSALALRLHEMGEQFVILCTPTGNELPNVWPYLRRLAMHVRTDIIVPPGPTLSQCIEHHRAIPNSRMRFCTREIKVLPAMAWMKRHPQATLAVGFRADEERTGIYGPDFKYRFPLQEWGWNRERVVAYCAENGLVPPARTDCAICFYQRLGEWWRLWRDHPGHWRQGELWEAEAGHTFRSPSRDTWPASLRELRHRFEAGDVPRGAQDEPGERRCKVCSM